MPPVDPLELFFANAAARAAHPAVVEGSRTWSYGDLAAFVRRAAKAIGERGNQPRTLIHLPQCAEAYGAMFSSLMVGGIYAPTNVTAPVQRQRLVLDAFKPAAIVTDTRWVATLGLDIEDPRLVLIDALPEEVSVLPAEPHDLAYVMFTSGSTGTPKGVMVPREGLAHYIRWAIDAMQITHHDRWSQHPNIGFDLSVLDIYGALCGGATLYPLISRSDRLMPGKAILRHGLTIWNSVPSVIDLMKRAEHMTTEHLASLRLITFCGEPLLESHLDAIFAARPDILVHNTYGPTEATVSFTLIKLGSTGFRDACRTSVALGDPISGMQLDLIGGETENEGEIVISGPQVARGYWRDDEQTRTAFGPMQLDGAERYAYRTGDWAVKEGGHFYFVSRIDRQVKIHGNRIELGEIDAALRACGVAVVYTVLSNGELHSFIEGNASVNTGALMRAVADALPSYAVPSAIHPIAHLPRNANDKIDSKALQEILENNGRTKAVSDSKGSAVS
jgi:D-alanine--poly(phosphoribitol) ligase subunit 1